MHSALSQTITKSGVGEKLTFEVPLVYFKLNKNLKILKNDKFNGKSIW